MFHWHKTEGTEPPNITGPDLANEIIDIDIGTLGKPIGRSSANNYLITFDPFDHKYLGTKYERLPYAVTTNKEEVSPFYVNQMIPGCSSLNRYNPIFDSNPDLVNEMWHGEPGDAHNCQPNNAERCCVQRCKHPKRRKRAIMQVPTIKLSTVIKQRNINKINFLKIDAQGSDKSILQDVLSTGVKVERIMAECQRYDKIHPIYDSQNDCEAMVKEVHHFRPEFTVEWIVNNCLNAEYNLIFQVASMKNTT